MNTTTARFIETMRINDRVTHATYGTGTIVDEFTFASGFSYSVRWDNGGPMSSSDCTWESPESLTLLRANPSDNAFGNASYGPYRVKVLGDFTHADPSHVVWVDYVFENGRGGTAPIATIKFDNAVPTEEEHYCNCDHCRDAGTCFGCTSGLCP